MLLTLKQAAEYMGVNPETIRRHAHALGEIIDQVRTSNECIDNEREQRDGQ